MRPCFGPRLFGFSVGGVTESGLRTCVSGKPSSMMQVFYNHIKFHLFEQEKDIEDFITSLDSQDKSRSPPVGLERKLDESGKSESTVVFFFLLSTFTVSESTEHQELHVQTAPCGDLPSAGICPLRRVCPRLCPLCLALWPGGLSGSLEAVSRALAWSRGLLWGAAGRPRLPLRRVPSASQSACAQLDWPQLRGSGWAVAHALL